MHTNAIEAANEVLTDAILAGMLVTIVGHTVAVCSLPSVFAFAYVTVDLIFALSVFTRT